MALTPDQLAEKLYLLKRRDPGLQLFGAATHRYSLNAYLPREELQTFEETVGITLPEEYRDFLLRFGNGGAGPGYGLLSLKESIDEFGNDPLQSLARPFIPPRSARSKVDDRAYPDDGLFPLAHMGCGHMCHHRRRAWGSMVLPGRLRLRSRKHRTPCLPTRGNTRAAHGGERSPY